MFFNSKKKIAFKCLTKYFESAPPELGQSGDNKQFFKSRITFLNIYSELYITLCLHLIHACEIWGQNQNNTLFQRISRLQEKVLHIINFKRHDTRVQFNFSKMICEFSQ